MLRATIVRLPDNLLRRAKKAAIDYDTSLQQLVTKALESYLRQKKEVMR